MFATLVALRLWLLILLEVSLAEARMELDDVSLGSDFLFRFLRARVLRFLLICSWLVCNRLSDSDILILRLRALEEIWSDVAVGLHVSLSLFILPIWLCTLNSFFLLAPLLTVGHRVAFFVG